MKQSVPNSYVPPPLKGTQPNIPRDDRELRAPGNTANVDSGLTEITISRQCSHSDTLHSFQMDNGDPLPSYEGLAAAFAKAKAEKEREEAQGLRLRTEDAKVANKRGEIQFKASHGLLLAFFTLILYELPLLSPRVLYFAEQYI
jgi:hypothetical protein